MRLFSGSRTSQSNKSQQDNLLKLVKTVPFPTISMNRVFKEKRKRHPPRRISEDVEYVKQEPKTSISNQKENPVKKSIPYYISYHQNKLGQTLKTIRCKKCSGFISRGQTECKMCCRIERKNKLAKRYKTFLKPKKICLSNNISKKKRKYITKKARENLEKLNIPILKSVKKKSKPKSLDKYEDKPPKLHPFNKIPETDDEEDIKSNVNPILEEIKPQKAKNKIIKKKTIEKKRKCECVVKDGKIQICNYCASQTCESKKSLKPTKPSKLFVEINNDVNPEVEDDVNDELDIDDVQTVIEIDEDSELELSVGLLENVIEKFERLSESEDEDYEETISFPSLFDHNYAMSI